MSSRLQTGSSGADQSKPSCCTTLVRTHMSSESNAGLCFSSLFRWWRGGVVAGLRPLLALRSGQRHVVKVVITPAKGDYATHSRQGPLIFEVKEHRELTALRGEQGTRVLGRCELASASLFSLVATLFLPSRLEWGRRRGSRRISRRQFDIISQ